MRGAASARSAAANATAGVSATTASLIQIAPEIDAKRIAVWIRNTDWNQP
jgi:hypothetical protein